MNRKAFVVVALCLASAGRLLAGDSPGAEDAFSLFKKDAAEEISEELKAQLLRKIEGLVLAVRLWPENVAGWLALEAAWVKLGVGDFRSGKIAEAKEALEKALAILPGDAKAAEGLATLWMQGKQPEQALEVVDRSLKVDSTAVHLWIFRAALLTSMGRQVEGGESLAKAREIEPGSRDVHAMGGFLAAQQHDLPKALAEYDLALKIEPNDGSLWNNRGAVLRLMGKLNEAIESCLHGLQLRPDDLTARRELAAWFSDAGRQDESARYAQEVIDQKPEDKEAWALLGQANVKRGRWKEGLEGLQKSKSLGFEDPKAELLICQAYIGLTEFDKADEILSGILWKEPENVDALAYLGSVRQKQKRTVEGIRYSEKALSIDPKNTTALVNRVTDYVATSQWDEASQYARRAVEIDPRFWFAWVAIGFSEEHHHHEKDAYAAFKKATEYGPEQMFGWQGVARFSPDADEAWTAAQKSAALAPKDPTAQILPVYVKIRFGKSAEAIPMLEAVVAAHPENQVAANMLKGLSPKLDLAPASEIKPEVTLEPAKKAPWKVIEKSDQETSEGTVHTYHIVLDKQASWALLAATCSSVKRSPELLEAAQKAAAEHPEDKEKLHDLGMIALALATDDHSFHHAAEAEGAFRKVVELGEDAPNARLWLAVALCAEGRYSEAESICKKVTEDDPKSVSAWTFLGQSRLGRGRGPEAVEAYAQCIALSPKEVNGWNFLSNAYSQMEIPDEGEKKLRELLKVYPDSAMGWLTLGQMLSVPGKYEDAIMAFRKSAELATPNPQASNGLAGVYQFQGKSAEAEKEFRRAIEQEPENPTFLTNLANCLLTEKKVDEAEKLSQRALEMRPNDVAANAILTQVYIEKGDMEAASAACDRLEALDANIAELLRSRIKK